MPDRNLKYKFDNFCYDSFEILKDQNKFILHFSVDDKYSFSPEYEINLDNLSDISQIEYEIFTFGLSEIPSYYKTFCASKIIINAGYLNNDQILFWQNLFEKGLGEFFYKNQIDFRNLINISCNSDRFKDRTLEKNRYEEIKVLVPIGGGKDSIITGEMMINKGINFSWFSLGDDNTRNNVIKISGNNKVFSISRDININFSLIKQLNNEGFPNGHVPISSVFAFGAVIIAKLHGFSYIAISQEKSANIGNVEYLNTNINHQYSKSYEAELAIHNYINTYISKDINYFSALRNLNEIQISKLFSQYSKYFNSFISCNKTQNQSVWCGNCAKCAFTYLILSPFINRNILIDIFKKDLLNDPELLSLYRELAGDEKIKPFDCVGTFEEVSLAFYLTYEKYLKEDLEIPFILKNIDVKKGEKNLNLLTEINSEHIIPEFLLT
ncbi:MAG: hypothetical protein WCJ19_04915 [bacterium]